MSTTSPTNIEVGMFAYGTTSSSKKEGVIGWVSKVNEKTGKITVSYRDGSRATWLLRIIDTVYKVIA